MKAAKSSRKTKTYRISSNSVCVVVMGNAFYGCQMANLNIFDLKGKNATFFKRKKHGHGSISKYASTATYECMHVEWRTGPQIDSPPPSLDTISLIPVRLDGDLMEITRGLPVPLKTKAKRRCRG